MEDKTQILHKILFSKGLYSKSYDEFSIQFSDEVKKEKLFNSLSQKGLYTKTYEEFGTQFFPVKKKDISFQDAITTASGREVLPLLEGLEERGTPPSPLTPKDRETTVIGDLLRSLKSASLRALGGIAETPMLINRTVQAVTIKPLMRAMGASDEEVEQTTDYINSLSIAGQSMAVGEQAQGVLNQVAAKTEVKIQPIEGNIVQNIREGNWGQAGELLGRGVIQSLPYLAMTTATMGGGAPAVLATIGATAAGQQYGELEGQPEGKRILNSWMYGGFEAVGELVTAGLLKGVGKSFRQGLIKEINPLAVKGAAKAIATGFGLESSSEAITQIGQNLTDIVTGVEPDRNIFDNVLDAGLIGGFAGGGIGSAQIGASVVGRALASDQEVEQVRNNVNEQKVLIDQVEITDSDPVKSALESRLRTLRYEADKAMDKNYELAKELTPEQRSKVAELFSVRNDLLVKIDNKEVTEQEIPAIENTIKGIEEEIQSIKEGLISELGEIKEEGVKYKIGEETFETKEAVEAWLDENYVRQGLDPVWHQPTEALIDDWVKRNKEAIDKKALEQIQEEVRTKAITPPKTTDKATTLLEGDIRVQPNKQDKDVTPLVKDVVFYNGGGNFDSESGIYFTPSETTAKSFAEGRGAYREDRLGVYDETKKSKVVTPALLNIKNPKKVEFSVGTKGEPGESQTLTKEKISELKEQGYDGMIAYGNGEIQEIVVFDKSQVIALQEVKETEPTAVTEIAEPRSAEDIAKANGITFIGKQEGVEEDGSDAIDLYNVKIGEQEATFAVPVGSNEATVQARKQETINRFKEETEDARREEKEDISVTEEVVPKEKPTGEVVDGVLDTGEARVEEKVTPKAEEVKFKQFVDIEKDRKTPEEAFKKASEIKDVSPEESKAFRDKYDPEGKLTPQQAFNVFYNEVKSIIEVKAEPIEAITPEKGITPPKKEITPPEPTQMGKNEREKALLNRMRNTKDLSPEFKEQITEKGLTYKGIPNSVTAEEVDYLIAEKGLDEMEKAVLNETSDLEPRVRVLVAARLIKALDTLASLYENTQDETAYRQRSVVVADFIDNTGRKWGQGIQEFASVEVNAIISPKTQTMRIRKAVRGQRDSQIEDNEKDISTKAKSMREANKESIDEALASRVYNKAKQGVTSKPKSSTVRDVSVPKEKIVKEQAYRKNQWDVFKKASGTASVSAVGLNKEQIEAIGNIIASYVREGFYRSEVLARKLATDWKRHIGKEISLEEARKMLPKEVEGKSLEELQAQGEEIEASTLIANRVMRMLKDPSVPQDDPIKQMVETLFGKITEKDKKEKAKPVKKTNLEKIKESLLNRKQYADVWDAAKIEVQQRINDNENLSEGQKVEYTERLQQFYDEVIGKPFSEKQVSAAIKDKLKELEISIDRVIRDHYTVYDATKRTLQEKLIEELGLTGEEAKMIADAVSKEFDKIAMAKKRAILKRGVTPKEVVRSKTAKQVHDKLIELTNLGAFSDTEFSEAYADKWGFPKLEPEQAKEIERLAKLVQDTPEGYQKFERTQDLLAYVENIKGIDMGDVGMSMWYSSILSGYRTQAKNFIQNTITSLFEGAISTITHPFSAFRLMQALGRGWGEGVRQFGHIMATGYNPIKSYKVETPNVLERFSFIGGNLNPANWAKYVTRIMVAADAFSYAGLKEMRSFEVAMNMARAENKNATEPTKSNWARATELLSRTSEKVAIAEEQARQEGLKGVEYRRRVWELIEQGRPKEMIEDAAHFAALGTFNYQPEGVLGMVTQAITFVTQGIAIPIPVPFTEKKITIRPGKFIIPFTRIIANVTNMALDYYPIVSLSRVAHGGVGHKGFTITPTTKKFYRKYTPEERKKVLIKAMVGLTAQIGFFLLSEPDDDGESAVEITANGYGDYQKNYELKETGWQPYSIKLGDRWWTYQYTPLMLALAPIGYFRDMQKYNKERFSEESVIRNMGIAHFKGIQVISDMTWAANLNSLLDAMKAKEPSQAQAYLTNLTASTAKSFIYPKIAEQITQVVDAAMEKPRRDTKTLTGRIFRDIPIVRNKYNNMLNAVGQPVMYDPYQMISVEKDDPFWTYLAEKNIMIGKPNAKAIFYDDITKTKRAMTDDEYYNFIKVTGPEIQSRIEGEVISKKLPDKEARQEITNIKAAVRAQAKVEMFGWGDFRTERPKDWETLKKNNAIQIPATTVIDWMTDDGKTKATEEEMVDYNDKAMNFYYDNVVDYLSEEPNKDETNEVTGGLVYNEQLDRLWTKARSAAKGEIIEERENSTQ